MTTSVYSYSRASNPPPKILLAHPVIKRELCNRLMEGMRAAGQDALVVVLFYTFMVGREHLRTISADEFAKRLRRTTEEQDKRFAFFVGAGCSISSDIPAAAQLVKNEWLPQLFALRAGPAEELEMWVKLQFPDYSSHDASTLYGAVMKELFLQPEDRQREIERLCEGKFPGFGYGCLANLMTIEGGLFNVVLTTNFDDLLSDALYLFTDARPLVIHHDSLAPFIRTTRTRPLIVKLHGDHRLSPRNTAQETQKLMEDIENRVRLLLHDRGLVFVGYGGNDQGIRELLEGLPPEALPLGVYWVSGHDQLARFGHGSMQGRQFGCPAATLMN